MKKNTYGKKKPYSRHNSHNKKHRNHNKRNAKKSIFCPAHIFLLAVYIIFIFVNLLIPIKSNDYDLRLTYAEDVSTNAQLYYDLGDDYAEEDSILSEVENRTADFVLYKKIRDNVTAFRFDPVFDPVAEEIPELSLVSLSLVMKDEEIKSYSGKVLVNYIDYMHEIDSNIRIEKECIVMAITGDDPYFIMNEDFMDAISDAVLEYNKHISKMEVIYSSIIAFSLCILLFLRGWFILLFNKMRSLVVNKIGLERASKIKTYWCVHTEKLSIGRKLLYGISLITFFLAVILHTLMTYFVDYFSGLSTEELVFHLKVPMEGTGGDMVAQYFKSARLQLIIAAVVCVSVTVFLIRIKKVRNCRLTGTLVLLCSLVLLVSSGLSISKKLNLPRYFSHQMQDSSFIEEHYAEPSESLITFPDTKRNLVYIYLESMESTFISKEEGGCMPEDIIPELTQLAKDNINFSENDKIGGGTSSAGSGWTVAAMVAMTSGLPLLLPIDGNSYGKYTEFLPGAVTLGEILEEKGYKQEIMVGSDASFGGRRNYFLQHGGYEIYDLDTARKREDLPDDYNNGWWGFEDAKLFSYAREEISRLAEGDAPFNFTMLTVDTHHVGGYVCELCEDEHEEQYENVLACSAKQVSDFVKWLQAQDFYDTTTIIISGDHPTMDAEYINAYYDNSQPRKVYNCFINAAKDAEESKNREFNTFDMFPTTLAAMGCEISGERLGLGTNLFSSKKTLAEEYGYEKIEEELSYRSKFYEKNILQE